MEALSIEEVAAHAGDLSRSQSPYRKAREHPAFSQEALSIEDVAVHAGICRSFAYRAVNPDPDKRGNIPLLKSLKIGRSRRVRPETLRAWLAELEASTMAAEAGGDGQV